MKVYISGKNNDEALRTLKAGDAFGELALMYNSPRTATVKVSGEYGRPISYALRLRLKVQGVQIVPEAAWTRSFVMFLFYAKSNRFVPCCTSMSILRPVPELIPGGAVRLEMVHRLLGGKLRLQYIWRSMLGRILISSHRSSVLP